jgi:hypothetical protein
VDSGHDFILCYGKYELNRRKIICYHVQCGVCSGTGLVSATNQHQVQLRTLGKNDKEIIWKVAFTPEWGKFFRSFSRSGLN